MTRRLLGRRHRTRLALAVELTWLQQQGGRFRTARNVAEQLRSALDCDEVREALWIVGAGCSRTIGFDEE